MSNINFEILNFNPIPIGTFNFEESFITKEHVEIFKQLSYERNMQSPVLVASGDKDHILSSPEFEYLKKCFDQAVNMYTSEVLQLKNNFKMIHSWVTKNEKNSYHSVHTHENVMLSAVAYFNDELVEEDFAPIIFYGKGLKNIFEDFNFDIEVKKYNEQNSKSWTIFPKLKQILVFPGHMLHQSASNDSDRVRYCIGTNYFIEGEVGVKKYTRFNISINE